MEALLIFTYSRLHDVILKSPELYLVFEYLPHDLKVILLYYEFISY